MPSTTTTPSQNPSAVRLPLVWVISLILNLVFFSVTAPVTGPELAVVSRNVDNDLWGIGALFAWKFVELAVAWYGGYDFLDLGYLALLNNVPYYFLLSTFYGITFVPLLVSLAIDVIAAVVPFALLRPRSAVNIPTRDTPNKEVAWDLTTRSVVVVLGASLYSALIFGSFMTRLPKHMILNFDGLRSLESAHNAALFNLLPVFVPTGFALAHFIFVPAISSAGNPGLTDPSTRPEKAPFNPETATLTDTLSWNLGLSRAGVSPRAKILLRRTATLAVGSFINTFVRTYITIEGTDIVGCLGWASVWALAAALTGLSFSWVGNE